MAAAAVAVASSNRLVHVPGPSQPPPVSVSSAPSDVSASNGPSVGAFALAQIGGEQVCLVQLTSPPLPLTPLEAQIYRHEFINIFRHSHAALLHPADLTIVELLEPSHVLSRDETAGTIFLARDVMARLGRRNDPRRKFMAARGGSVSRCGGYAYGGRR